MLTAIALPRSDPGGEYRRRRRCLRSGNGADTIAVPAGTYVLGIAPTVGDTNQTGDLDIVADLTISGANAGTTIIDGNDLDRVFDIDPSAAGVTAEIFGLTIQNGAPVLDGLVSSSGGAIANRGTLTLNEYPARQLLRIVWVAPSIMKVRSPRTAALSVKTLGEVVSAWAWR